MNKQDRNKPGLGFRCFKQYVKFYHDKIYYRKVYALNTDHIPDDVPLMIVSNHQNSVCDPLALLFAIPNRKARKIKIISRADVFNKPTLGRFLNWLGILPAYRLAVDGENYFENNQDTFKKAENELLNNGTIIIFPEGKHQNKRWLGKFSSGYLHILFEAAQKSNFEKEIFVLPSCNHYSNYFDTKEDVLIKFGTPISLQPFYELYQTKPRTAMRQVNALVRKQVEDLMLNITDLENYNEIDYLRNTYGIRYAQNKGYEPNKLPEKLIADKQFFDELESAKNKDPELVEQIYNDTNLLHNKTEGFGLVDNNFERTYNPIKMCLSGIFFILFFPVFVLATIPNIMIVFAPNSLTDRVKDPMLHSSIKFASGLLMTLPILYFLSFLLLWKGFGLSLLFSLVYLATLPLQCVFAVQYKQSWRLWRSQWRYFRHLGKGEIFDLIALRRRINNSLDNTLNTNTKFYILKKMRKAG